MRQADANPVMHQHLDAIGVLLRKLIGVMRRAAPNTLTTWIAALLL